MIKQKTYRLDILKERRRKNNTTKSTISTIKKLRKQGFLYALIITLTGVSICSFTAIHTFRRIKYKEELITKAGRYDELKTRYTSLKKNLASVLNINNNIAQGILGVKSSSALLEELKQIIPKTIQLKSIEVIGEKLISKGRAIQHMALDSINSLKIQISNSFFIENKSTLVTKIESSDYKNKNSIDFILISKFKKLSSQDILNNYKKLGSFGLLKRVKILKEEGLIK